MLNEYIRLYHEKEELYERWWAASEKLNVHSANILKEFGLPDRFPYSHYLSRLIDAPNREIAIKELLVKLHKLGTEYADQEPKHNLQILREAKQNLASSDDILPSLGVVESSYAEFLYNEIFLASREKDQNCLSLLKDANSYDELGHLLYLHQRIREINKKLDCKNIPYFLEFLKQDPENDELVELFNPQHQITEEDEAYPDYRSQLVKTRNVFEDAGQALFTCLVNVAMSGELNEEDEFEVGEVLNFKESDFRSLDDQNVQLIIKVLDAIGRSCASMININNLDSEGDLNETPF